ncbi:MAG: phytanoyl-CoA dioxygenase [Rhodospirillaceae bacterium]|nr:phytanoyl-CoA dioxygenase [Rhodospirillaceae bacterium]
MATLTAAEIKNYREKGFVIPDFKISEQKLKKLRSALEQTLTDNPKVRPEQLASIHTPKAGPDDTVGHSAFLEVALDEELVELVSCILGDDVIMWGAQLFCKPGSDGMEVPMHQDGQYWPIRPLATCTIWLAIDDSDRDNGCLQVSPGSHRTGIHYNHKTEARDNLVLNQAIDDPRLKDMVTEYVELEAGQLSLHDVFLVHGSSPNTSGKRRAGFTVRYMPSSSVLRREMKIPFAGYPVDWAEKPLWLAKGRDLSGENDFERGHN